MAIADVSELPLGELLSLSGQNVVITGGARGIGLSIAKRLAEAGASVALGDLNVAGAEQAATDLYKLHRRPTMSISLDVRDAASIEALAQKVVDQLGSIDIWINNAAIYPISMLVQMSEREMDDVFDINLRGTLLGCREAARRMLAAKQDKPKVILNIASVSGFRGLPGLSHYAASKHGVVGLTKSLAAELGPYGIRVVGIAPTLVSTPGIVDRKADDASENAKNLEARVSAGLPLGRIAVPDDVARVALFCVSKLAMLVTGTTVVVDAGALAG